MEVEIWKFTSLTSEYCLQYRFITRFIPFLELNSDLLVEIEHRRRHRSRQCRQTASVACST